MNIKGLTAIIGLFFFLSKASFAQGILPPKKEKQAVPPASPFVLIGNSVPESLTVLNENRDVRALLSYKAANDVLVVGFYSARCPQNQEAWSVLRRIYQDYKGWHTAFVGIKVQPDETLEDLSQAMVKAGLPYTVVRDDEARVAHALHITRTPQIAIVDEYGYLRYRGDLKHVRTALESIIGHEPMPVDPETSTQEGCAVP